MALLSWVFYYTNFHFPITSLKYILVYAKDAKRNVQPLYFLLIHIYHIYYVYEYIIICLFSDIDEKM